jgi:hypothetical protein
VSKRLIILGLLVVVSGWACAGGDDDQGHSARLNPGEFQTGTWAATATVPGGDIGFYIELTRASEDAYGATLLNGEERVPIRSVTADGNALTLFFPAYNSTIEASLENGALVGTLTVVKRGGVEQTMPFRAEYAQGYTYSIDGPEPEINLSGRWDVTFLADDGTTSSAIGEFEQDGSNLRGTFLKATGDSRYLSGSVTGRSLELTCFDGSHAYLYKGVLDEDDRLEGDYWSGTKWYQRWRARRDDDAALPDPYGLTYLREGYDEIAFRFPALDGTVISHEDDRFAGKVVIVALAGSWCPNSGDAATFLSQYYKETRARGLEIVMLMYEHLRDEKSAMTQIARFKDRHDIEFTVLYAGYSDKEEAHETLPMLNHIMSYPTMIFIDRHGKVRRIHTGFSGPATGEHYAKFKLEFAEFVDKLLAE